MPIHLDMETVCPTSNDSVRRTSKRKAGSISETHSELMQGTLNKLNLRITSDIIDRASGSGGAVKRQRIHNPDKSPLCIENQAAIPQSSSRLVSPPDDIQQDVLHRTPPIMVIINSFTAHFRSFKALWSTPDPPPSTSSDATGTNHNDSPQGDTRSSLDGIDEDSRSNELDDSSSLDRSSSDVEELDVISVSHDSESMARSAKDTKSARKTYIAHSSLNEISPESFSQQPSSDYNHSSSHGSSPGPPSPATAPPIVNERKDTGIFAKSSLIAYPNGFRGERRTVSAVITLDSGSDIDAIASSWALKHKLKRHKFGTAQTAVAINGESVTIKEWVSLAYKFEGRKEWMKLCVIENNEDFEILYGAETIKKKGIYKKEGSGKLYIATAKGEKKLSPGKYCSHLCWMEYH
jgi:hypothetical protein